MRGLLPDSRSVRQLGECVETILNSDAVRQKLTAEMSSHEWVEGYLERPETHPKG